MAATAAAQWKGENKEKKRKKERKSNQKVMQLGSIMFIRISSHFAVDLTAKLIFDKMLQ